jgi:hypothetical protein
MARPPRTLLPFAARALAWVGAFVIFWSMNVVWGNDPDMGEGPPVQWKRQVVGAILLAVISAGALTLSWFRGGPPGRVARLVTVVGGLAILLIAWWLHHDAMRDFPHLIQGPGWRWLLAGGGFVLAGASLAMAAPPAEVPKKTGPKKPPRRRG